MGLTRITKGVIKPNEDYQTGIITATGIDVNGNADVSGNLSVGGVLTYEDVTSIDSVGIITAQKDIHVGAGVSVVGIVTAATGDFDDFVDVGSNIKLGNAGVITATSFVGSGAALTGLDKQITIGMRAGVAVTFAATGSSFNVVGRSGNIPISF